MVVEWLSLWVDITSLHENLGIWTYTLETWSLLNDLLMQKGECGLDVSAHDRGLLGAIIRIHSTALPEEPRLGA